jgi:hypothetical protein
MFTGEMSFEEIVSVAAAAFSGGGFSLPVAIAAALMLSVTLGRKFLASRYPFFKTDLGGSTLVLALSAVAGVSNALLAGTAVSFSLILGVAVTAMGGYTGLKKFVLPLLDMAESKFPSWTRIVFVALRGILGSAAGITATKAGAQAVTKSPGKGVKGVLGEPKKFPKVKGAKAATRSRP